MTRPAFKVKEEAPPEVISPVQPRKVSEPGQAAAGTGSINARIDPLITTTLMRASLDRRIAGKELWTQREIIADALSEWLKKHGYMK